MLPFEDWLKITAYTLAVGIAVILILKFWEDERAERALEKRVIHALPDTADELIRRWNALV
jgi:hypothetical protein